MSSRQWWRGFGFAVVMFWVVPIWAAQSIAELQQQAAAYQQELVQRYKGWSVTDPQQLPQTLRHFAAQTRQLRYDIKAPLELALAKGDPAQSDLWLLLARQPFSAEERKQKHPIYAAIIAYQLEQRAGSTPAATQGEKEKKGEGKNSKKAPTPKLSPLALEALRVAATNAASSSDFDQAVALQQQVMALQTTPAATDQTQLQHYTHELQKQQSLLVTGAETQHIDHLAHYCITFSAGLKPSNPEGYRPYIHLQPAPAEWSLRYLNYYQNEQLCIGHLTAGQSYQVEIAAGLTAADGEKRLQQPWRSEWQQAADLKPDPNYNFASERLILPASGREVVPLQHRYADDVAVALFRIDPRNLANDRVRAYMHDFIADYHAHELASELGEMVWRADFALERSDQAVKNHYLELPKAIVDRPGLYLLIAGSTTPLNDYTIDWCDGQKGCFEPLASQWLLISDVALSSYLSPQQLTVVTRSLERGLLLPSVRVDLLSRSNALLYSGTTNEQGRLDIPATALQGKRGGEPLLLVAWQDERHFSLINLEQLPLDLAGKGAGGRAVTTPLDLWLQSERGVYRPGEPVNLMGLLRNPKGEAVAGLPLYLTLIDPQQQQRQHHQLQPEAAGSYRFQLTLPAEAVTGSWLLEARAEQEGAILNQYRLEVQEVTPPRLKVALERSGSSGSVAQGREAALALQADYLFGAKGGGLAVTARAVVTALAHPYTEWEGFQFGPLESDTVSAWSELPPTTTDEQGRAVLHYTVGELPNFHRPALATLYAQVIDVDGREVAVSQKLPIHQHDRYHGLRLQPGSSPLTPVVEAVVVNSSSGQLEAHSGLEWRLLKQQWLEQWSEIEGRWQVRWQKQLQPLQSGSLKLPTAAVTPLPLTLERDQSYQLELKDPQTGVISVLELGEYRTPEAAEEGGKLLISSDRPHYQAGDTAKITVQAPFSGQLGLLVAVHDRIVAQYEYPLTATPLTISLPVGSDWGVGANLLFTAYQGMVEPAVGGNAPPRHLPKRLVANHWLDSGSTAAELKLQIEAPPKTTPQQKLPVTVRVANFQPDQPTFVTLLAVDEGVLQLTDFASPNPLTYFFSQRQLPVAVRDLYSAIIDTTADHAIAQMKQGYDAALRSALRGRMPREVAIVSLATPVVAVDGEGKATLPLDLPEFNGELRLMAVAWSPRRLGATAQPLTVRHPLVLEPSLPKQLVAGDRSQLTLQIHNLEGAAGAYALQISASGLTLPPEQQQQTLPLQAGEKRLLKIPITAAESGRAEVTIALSGQGVSLTRSLALPIAPPTPFRVEREVQLLQPGETITLEMEPSRYTTTPLSAQISASQTPAVDMAGVLAELESYPYGCLEQVTSRALPLLYSKQLASAWQLKPPAEVDSKIRSAINRLIEKQNSEGGFGLWSATGEENRWLSGYAVDFLHQAVQQGYSVPMEGYQRGLQHLSDTLRSGGGQEAAEVHAYTLYLLARAGQLDRQWLQQFTTEQRAAKTASTVTLAHLAAAHYQAGLPEEAKKLFTAALKHYDALTEAEETPYGSLLRDGALLITLWLEAKQPIAPLQSLLSGLMEYLNDWGGSLSTQDKAWLIQAVRALGPSAEPVLLRYNGQTIEPTRYWQQGLEGAALYSPQTLENRGQQPIWVSWSLTGAPTLATVKAEQAEAQRGEEEESAAYTVQQSYLSLEGKPVDLSRLKSGDLVVALLTVEPTYALPMETLVVDRIPAGLELENSALLHRMSAQQLPWLSPLAATDYSELLEDRFVAALTLRAGKAVKLAYIARVVTPGHYTDPAPFAEAMFDPSLNGQGELRQWDIATQPSP